MVGTFDEVFHPEAARAAEIRLAQQQLPADAPAPALITYPGSRPVEGQIDTTDRRIVELVRIHWLRSTTHVLSITAGNRCSKSERLLTRGKLALILRLWAVPDLALACAHRHSGVGVLACALAVMSFTIRGDTENLCIAQHVICAAPEVWHRRHGSQQRLESAGRFWAVAEQQKRPELR